MHIKKKCWVTIIFISWWAVHKCSSYGDVSFSIDPVVQTRDWIAHTSLALVNWNKLIHSTQTGILTSMKNLKSRTVRNYQFESQADCGWGLLLGIVDICVINWHKLSCQDFDGLLGSNPSHKCSNGVQLRGTIPTTENSRTAEFKKYQNKFKPNCKTKRS